MYTFFLAIALVAILVAILFLCLEMSPYEFKFKGGPAMVRIDAQGTRDGGVRETHQYASSAVRFTHSTMT